MLLVELWLMLRWVCHSGIAHLMVFCNGNFHGKDDDNSLELCYFTIPETSGTHHNRVAVVYYWVYRITPIFKPTLMFSPCRADVEVDPDRTVIFLRRAAESQLKRPLKALLSAQGQA